MNIPINEDFEKDYKIEIWKGFDLKEFILLAAGAVIGGGLGCILYFILHLDITISFYLGIIPVMPFIVVGFWKSAQGLSLPKHLEMKDYQKRTRRLLVNTGEYEREKANYFKTEAFIRYKEEELKKRRQDADRVTAVMKKAYRKDLKRRNRQLKKERRLSERKRRLSERKKRSGKEA